MIGTGIVYADDDFAATAALFARPMQETQDYIAKQVHHYVQVVGQTVGGIADNVMARFNEIRNSALVSRIENMRSQLNGIWEVDAIRPLVNIQDVQRAPAMMHRWVMANPLLRAAWNRDGCSGYDGAYVDIKPGGVGPTHYDYRRVMNGVVKDGCYTNYREQLINPDDVLNIIEKRAITSTWLVIDNHLEESTIDPTDPWNGQMG